MYQPIGNQGGNLVFLIDLIDPKNTNLVEDVEVVFVSSFVKIYRTVSEEKSKMSQVNRG